MKISKNSFRYLEDTLLIIAVQQSKIDRSSFIESKKDIQISNTIQIKQELYKMKTRKSYKTLF